MEQQMGESSGVKSPVLGPDMDHMSTSPVDQTEELLEAYAALEIEDDGTDEQPFDESCPTEEKQYGSWLRATNRRSSPATGRRWLVLDQERSGGNPPVQRSGSGTEHSVPVTVPGTPHSQNIPQCTVPSRDERVSTVHMVGGEGTKVAANLSGGGVVDSTDCDGLTIVDQKRRRVDDDFDKRLSYWRKRMESTKSRRDPMGTSTFQEAQAQYI
nr:uncharacterized protein LOC109147766 [Ipomoea batatas]